MRTDNLIGVGLAIAAIAIVANILRKPAYITGLQPNGTPGPDYPGANTPSNPIRSTYPPGMPGAGRF